MSRTSAVSPETFSTFGDLLKQLRKQAGLTQLELSIAVGYSDTQISRMEQNQRVPDTAALTDYLRAKKLLLVLDNCEHRDSCGTRRRWPVWPGSR